MSWSLLSWRSIWCFQGWRPRRGEEGRLGARQPSWGYFIVDQGAVSFYLIIWREHNRSQAPKLHCPLDQVKGARVGGGAEAVDHTEADEASAESVSHHPVVVPKNVNAVDAVDAGWIILGLCHSLGCEPFSDVEPGSSHQVHGQAVSHADLRENL